MARSGLPRPDAVLLRLRLIGRMEALTLGNESVLPLGRKTRGLLAILALGGRRPVLRLRLAELLWSRRSEEQARASLRQEIHRLGEALSPVGTDVITVERHTLALKPALTSVDAERILTARPDQADTLPPIEGVLLEELNGTDPALDLWLAAERIRLRDHAMGLFEEMLRRQRDPQGTLDAARQLLALDGQHERAWQASIRAQLQLGNEALARQLAERCLATLDPPGLAAAGPELRDLLQELRFEQDPDAPAYELSARAVDRGGDTDAPGRAPVRAPVRAQQDGAVAPARPDAAGTGSASPAGGQPAGREPAAAPSGLAAGSTAAGDGVQPGAPSSAAQPIAGQAGASQAGASQTGALQMGALQTGVTQVGANQGVPGDQPPLIVVVPVLVLDASGDPRIGHFASGLAQALQAGLLTCQWARVLTGSELQDSLSQGRDDAVLRRRFGVRYVMDGTLQRVGDVVRVILRLSDIGDNGQLLWAQRSDGTCTDLLALQDRAAGRATACLPTELVMAEAQRARRRPEAGLDPRGLSALALYRLNDGDRAGAAEAISMLARGIEKAPDSMHLRAALTTAHLLAAQQRWGDPAGHADAAEAAARAALGLEPGNALLMASCAYVLGELRDRPDAALALAERALSISPHAAEAQAVRAHALVRLGRLDEAARCFDSYKALFPTHPFQALLDLPDVMIPLLRGDNEDAARRGLLHTELRPGYVPVLVPYLAALGHLRQSAEAERVRARLLQSWPDCCLAGLVDRAGLRDPAQKDRLRLGLELAGLCAEAGGVEAGGVEARAAGTGTARPGTRRPPLGVEPLAG